MMVTPLMIIMIIMMFGLLFPFDFPILVSGSPATSAKRDV
jgi:hypothetical protein